MKLLILLSLLVVISCQNKTPEATRSAERVSTPEEELGGAGFVFVPNVQGIEIGGEKISREGKFSVGENITINEASSGKTIDEFSVLDWGPVAFTTEDQSVKVYPVKDVLEISYTADDSKKIKKTFKCQFNNKPDPKLYQEQATRITDPKADLDSIMEYLAKLAMGGDSNSYNFFVHPSPEARKVLSSPSGVESSGSIIKTLTYMKNHGCNW